MNKEKIQRFIDLLTAFILGVVVTILIIYR